MAEFGRGACSTAVNPWAVLPEGELACYLMTTKFDNAVALHQLQFADRVRRESGCSSGTPVLCCQQLRRDAPLRGAMPGMKLGRAGVCFGAPQTQFACLHAAVPPGLTPFQVFACDDGAVGLLGEFDLACQAAFGRALQSIQPAPDDSRLIFDMSAVRFMDHHALLTLDSYAAKVPGPYLCPVNAADCPPGCASPGPGAYWWRAYGGFVMRTGAARGQAGHFHEAASTAPTPSSAPSSCRSLRRVSLRASPSSSVMTAVRTPWCARGSPIRPPQRSSPIAVCTRRRPGRSQPTGGCSSSMSLRAPGKSGSPGSCPTPATEADSTDGIATKRRSTPSGRTSRYGACACMTPRSCPP